MNKVLAIFILLAVLVTFVQPATIVIEVGYDNQLKFFPNDIKAETGDSILFKFVSGNHDVVQSDKADSCEKSTDPNAFQSEINPPSREFTIPINQTSGNIWYFCSVDQHCAAGMKGVIKVTSNNTQSDAITITNSFIAISFALAIFLLLAGLVTISHTADVTVNVGNAAGANVFEPATVMANVGDNVVFNWVSGTHSVIESDAKAACIKSAKPDAFASGGAFAAPKQFTVPAKAA
ncbi:Cupredoxin, partial [Glomus cerebriforme]